MAKTIAICNQKGGVGKTTTAVNLSACLAVLEKKTLLIDIDPQANASQSVGINEVQEEDIYEALALTETPEQISKERVEQIIKHLNPDYKLNYLHVLPSSPGLAKMEIELVNAKNRERRLHRLIDCIDGYDYIIIDAPPSLNLLTINTLAAADSVVVPVQSEYFSLQGVAELLNTIKLVQGTLNRDLKIEGALLTMCDTRNTLAKQVVDEVKKNFPGRVFNTIIPRNVKLAEAPSHGKPVLLYDIQSAGSLAYMKFTEELLNG